MAAARSPSPASRAQDYKLGGPPEERRYTCPSYELIRVTEPPADWPTASRVDLPGFRPVEAYEAAIANLAPELTRRSDPDSVERGARVGGHADRDRRGRRGLRPRDRRRAHGARARRARSCRSAATATGPPRRLTQRHRPGADPSGSAASFRRRMLPVLLALLLGAVLVGSALLKLADGAAHARRADDLRDPRRGRAARGLGRADRGRARARGGDRGRRRGRRLRGRRAVRGLRASRRPSR